MLRNCPSRSPPFAPTHSRASVRARSARYLSFHNGSDQRVENEVAPTSPESGHAPREEERGGRTGGHGDAADASDPQRAAQMLSAYDLEIVKRRIRDWTEQAALTVRHRADDFTTSTRTTFSQLGQHLNKVTGYEEIEALKRSVAEQEAKISATRQAARAAKAAYEQAVVQRSNSQREVNDLLQRKSLWTDGDVGRFTSLVRQDHLYEQEETRAKAAVDETEDAVEREFSQLLRTILARYHEEQVWSDKIRSASTYGSLAALGLNLIVFLTAIIFVEPWKRRRLSQTFEEKILQLSQENAKRLDESMRVIEGKLEEQRGALGRFVTEAPNEVLWNDKQQEDLAGAEVEEIPVESTSRRGWDITAIGTGAFLLGVLGSYIIRR